MRPLYRAGWMIALPLARLAARGDGKLARTIRGRLAALAALEHWAAGSRGTQPLLWFHAASVGEGRQAEAVMLEVRRLRPHWQLAYTFASASAERIAPELPADVHAYLPPDTRQAMRRALAALQPAAVVFAATDVWPELVRQATLARVPCALVSANLGPRSSRRGGLARALLGDAYTSLAAAGAVDAAAADGLADLGVPRAKLVVTGDSRHDAVAARAAAPAPAREALRAQLGRDDRPLLVAGSTWSSDERELLPALAALPAGAARVAIAPHEPSVAALGRLADAARAALPRAAVRRLGELEHAAAGGAAAAPWDVCLVDRVGALFDLYALAHVAYVGGGFHGAGLHSVIEPAAFGVPVVCGPRWRTSRDAGLLLDAGGLAHVTDAAGLAGVLGRLLSNDAARAAQGRAARAVVDRGAGAAARSAQLVAELAERRGIAMNS